MPDPIARCGAAIQDGLSSSMAAWGGICARHTWKVFFAFSAFALLCMGGISMSSEETDESQLWTPSNAQALDDQDLFESMFGSGFRTQTIYVKAQDDGNMMTRAGFVALKQLDDKILNEWKVTVDDEIYGFQQLCEKIRDTDPCRTMTFNPVDTFNEINNTFSVPAEYEMHFASVTRDASNMITEARTIKLTYFTSRKNDTNTNKDNCKTDLNLKGAEGCNPMVVWEQRLLKNLEEWDAANDQVKIFAEAEESISEVLGSLINGDLVALQIGIALIVIYSILVLGKIHPVLCRSGAAFGGVVCVGLAVGGTYGLAGYFDVPQTPVTSLLPFILLGIGVDDMFVLAGALNRAPKHLDLEGRITYMMREAGSSIVVTSLTDMLAFALGTSTTFPALKYFCIYAAIGIILDFVFQVTIFTCFMKWDEDRIQARGRDCFCFAVCCAKKGGTCDCCYVDEEAMDKTYCGANKEGGYLRAGIKAYLAPTLKIFAVKIVVIVVFLAMLCVGGVGLGRLKEDFSQRFFVPSDDPLQEVFKITDEEFNTGEISISILLDHRENTNVIFMHNTAALTEVQSIKAKVEEFEWYETGTLESPLERFQAVNTVLIPESDVKMFYDEFHSFLATPFGAKLTSMVSLHQWYANMTDFTREKMMGKGAGDSIDFGNGLSMNYDDFHPMTMRPLSAENFCTLLKHYLANEGAGDVASISPALPDTATCYPPGGDVRMHRITADMKCRLDEGKCPQSNATAEVLVMEGIREKMAETSSPLKPLPFSFSFLFTEQYAVVRQEAIVNISLAIVAVFVITVLLISHWACALLVVLNVAMVLIDLIGLMWLWDVSINSVSIINLVLAIGLAVDYSAHIAHAFMGASGTRDERMEKSLGEMGADVMHGAISTFIAVLITGTSKSYIFQVFFRQFFGICFFGMLHGIILLPVLLSLIGPPTHVKEEENVELELTSNNGEKQVATVSSEDPDDDINKAYNIPDVSNSQHAPDMAVGPTSEAMKVPESS